MANINELVDWALVPIILLIKTFFKAIAFIIRPAIALFQRQPSLVSQSGKVTFKREKEREAKNEM